MLFLGFALLLLVLALVGLVRTVRDFVTFTRVRREGVRVPGSVVGNEARRRYYYGGYWLVPVVRYQVDGKSYECPVANFGDRAEEGIGMDLVVDRDEPWRPWCAYGISGRAVVATGALTVCATLLVLWAAAYL